MDTQERQKRFIEALEVARDRFGVTIQATIHTEKLGDALLSKPVLQIVPVPGWIEDNVQKET